VTKKDRVQFRCGFLGELLPYVIVGTEVEPDAFTHVLLRRQRKGSAWTCDNTPILIHPNRP
jgi:hypothetical protein